MSPSAQPVRSLGRLLLVPLAAGLLASCSDDGLPPGPNGPPTPASLELISPNPMPGMLDRRLPDPVLVRVVDRDGRGVSGVGVHFRVTGGHGWMESELERTDALGYARGLWSLGREGEQTATVQVDGLAPVPVRSRVIPVQGVVGGMLGTLGYYLPASLATLQQQREGNPQLHAYIDEKIALLQRPGLGGEILEQGRFAEGSFVSRSGAAVPIGAVFPLEAMRGEVLHTIHYAGRVIPILEDFLGMAFPTPTLQVWHGFTMGMAGGGGAIYMEDEATYQARARAGQLPYDAGIVHELAHSYVGNEALTQFLEVYVYNVLQTHSVDLQDWRYTRDYVPDREGNEGVHALLDVYRLIGPQAMADAYRAILPLRPGYGRPLSAEVQRAFVEAVPAAHRPAVTAKVARVLY